jgi:hypothetical protein
MINHDTKAYLVSRKLCNLKIGSDLEVETGCFMSKPLGQWTFT